MSAPDRTTQQVREWLRSTTPSSPDAERSVDQVMSTLFQQTQLRPQSSFRFRRGRSWGEGGFSVFSALKLGVATAVIALVGGVLAISGLPDPQADQVPAAATESSSPEVAIEDLPPYAAVTGKMWPGANTYGPTKDPDHPGPGTLWRDWVWELRLEVDDPRLNGPFRTNQNYLLFEDDSRDAYNSRGSLRTTIGTLENEGGSWTQAGYGFSKPGSSSYSANNYVLFFTGEGGYEGLTVMLFMVPAGSYWQLDGVIAPGPFPEQPTSLDPAAAG